MENVVSMEVLRNLSLINQCTDQDTAPLTTQTVVQSELPFSHSFYATVCYTCKEHCVDVRGHTLLKRCRSCRLVSYCCVEHQKEHWPQHKGFCSAIQNILRKMGITKLFDESMRMLNAKEWNTIRHQLLIACEIELNRPLSLSEKQMLMFPRVCNICHDPSSEYLVDCANCRSVSYCSQEHRKADEKRHNEDCYALKQAFDLNLVGFKEQGKVNHLPVVSSTYPSVRCEDYLNCLKKFAAELSTQNVINSEVLTCPMTIVYAAYKLGLLNAKNLTVHVVGVSTLESGYFAAWENIFHWLTEVKKLDIFMIGPEEEGVRSAPSLCESCVKRQNVLRWSVSAGFYSESVAGLTNTVDMIVAFNCGFGEFTGSNSDTWAASIPVMLETGAPIVFTSYTHDEAISDMKALQLACGGAASVKAYGEKNMFCSYFPHRDWECDEENKSTQVFYKNNYLSVVQKKIF